MVQLTIANDWLSRIMGQGPSFTGSWATGAASANNTLNATSFTVSGGSFPTTGQGLQGCWLVLYGLTNNSFVAGVITTNTATVITVDQWYSPTSTTGAAGTTPTLSGGSASTGVAWLILPGGAPAPWMAVSATVHSPVVGDTTLTGELGAGTGFTRGVGTYAHSTSATTYTLALLWTASATETIINEAQFNCSTTTNAGYMPFESAEPNSPTLVSGDTLTNTATITV